MADNLTTCVICGRLFKGAPGQTCCSRCADACFRAVRYVERLLAHVEDVTPESLAEALGRPVSEVREIIKGSRFLQDVVQVSESCRRCRVNLAEPGIAYCADCRDQLKSGLDSARHAVSNEREQLESQAPVSNDGSRTGVRNALEERRRRRHGHGNT